MAEIDRAAIKQRLADSREQAGLTQPEMGETLSDPVHWRTVQNWESPKNKTVPFDRLDDWARITDTTKHWLLHGEEGGVTLASRAAEPRQDALGEVLSRLEALGDALANLEKGQAELLRRVPARKAAPQKRTAAATKRRR